MLPIHGVWLFPSNNNPAYFLRVFRITTCLESINIPTVMIEQKRITVVLKISCEICSPIWKNLKVANQLIRKLACSRITPMIRMNLLNPFLG